MDFTKAVAAFAQSSKSLRLQEAFESLHHASDRSRVNNECLRYFHAAPKLPIIDNYVSGKLALLCDVQSICEVDAIRRLLGSAEAGSGPPFARFILHLNSVNMALCQNRDKEPVFVPVCEAVNGPDGGISSVARLYPVNDECEEVRAGSVYVSLSQCALKFFDGFVDREFGPIADIGGSELFNRLEPSVIEGAIQIVDGVSSDESDLVETRFVKSMGESLGSMLRVSLDNSSIGLFKSVDAPLDISDVYIGPFDLSSGFQEVHAGILSDDCWVASARWCVQDGV